MNKKQLQWSAAGAVILLLALIIAIVSNKETPETVTQESVSTETETQSKPTELPDEPTLQVDQGKEQTTTEKTEKDGISPEEPEKEQPTKPVTGSSNNVPGSSETQPSTQETEPAESQNETKPTPTTSLKDGTYQVGTDIEPGEYLVFSNGITLLENTKNQSGNPESIVFNVALDGRSHTYVTLLEGEYFTLKGGEMYPVASAPTIKPANGIYKDGQYKVGTDIPAGSYTLLVEDESDIGFYEISKNSRQDMMDLLVSDVVEGETSITVTNGQYLTIRNAYLEVQ